MKLNVFVGVALCLLPGCYFNTAGHIFGKASYNATANTKDVKVGDTIYRDSSGEYYIELPRYRTDKKIITQYTLSGDNSRPIITESAGDTNLFQISSSYAMYLAGKGGSAKPSFLTLVKNADSIKRQADKLTVSRVGESVSTGYRYNSPNSIWWYTAGAFDWLCVDLPVTCVENSLLIASSVVLIATASNKSSSSSSSSGSNMIGLTRRSTQSSTEEYQTKKSESSISTPGIYGLTRHRKPTEEEKEEAERESQEYWRRVNEAARSQNPGIRALTR